ncbi:MAG: D-alanyl-D-alanine carboxypeptidase [Parcubacteria group bacterium GW2011_GWA2_50_10b]|nr:MAG: D-alanyl-D-alanine carboxypeptidase [Parcubacteria group bacterium GW2011_GWA2_50_10b]
MPEQSFINRNIEFRFFATLLVSVSLLIVTSYVLGSKVERGDASMPTEAALKPFPEVALTAKAAYVYDARTKTVLLALNENTRMPLASLTKLMTALVATELSPAYCTVTVGKDALSAEGDSGLRPGERWSLKDLLDFSLVSSSNDGIRAVALALGALGRSDANSREIIQDFVVKMNQKATELDLKNTYFWNETGLDETELKGGAYGTARDMATLLEHIIAYHPEMLEATKESSINTSSLDGLNHEAKNTNVIADKIPGFIGSKTGFTDTAGGNLIFAFDPELGRPIVISVMGSTEEGRFADAETLINAVLTYLNQN